MTQPADGDSYSCSSLTSTPRMREEAQGYRKEKSFPFETDECLSFTGHRHLTAQDVERLDALLPQVLEEYYQQGKRVFLSGGALGFDTLAAQAVLALRKKHPAVQLIMVLPCHSQASRWSPADRRIYQDILADADRVIYVSEDYFPGCMQKRNRFLVQHANVCLCFLLRCRGGTWTTVSYAYDLRRIIRNLAMEI